MVLAAELGTLAVEQAFALGLEPGLVHAARHGIDLHTEGRHGESVDHVTGGDEETDMLANGNHDFVVDGQKARIDGLVFLAGGGAIVVMQKETVEGERVLADLILITPVPLETGGLDGQFRLFRGSELLGQQLEGGNGKEQEDDDRAERPDDLDSRVVAGLGRHRVLAFAELDDDDDEQKENEQGDRNDEPQCVLLEPANFFHDRGRGGLEALLPVERLISEGGRSKEQTAKSGQTCKSFVFHNVSPQGV